jgi:hypothetical protein
VSQLEGSEQQIAWATEIRSRWLAKIDDLLAPPSYRTAPSDADRAALLRVRAFIASRTSAKTFIDHRDKGLALLLKNAKHTDWRSAYNMGL